METSLHDPEALFGDIVDYVKQARTIIARGEWVELAGLDTKVEELCSLVTSLSHEQAKEYAPELTFLREQIAELGAEMETHKQGLKAELKETGIVARANRAYAQGAHLKESDSEA